jgi:endonuclease/exonuclease/phosphatase family metal-dependent hydrolase
LISGLWLLPCAIACSDASRLLPSGMPDAANASTVADAGFADAASPAADAAAADAVASEDASPPDAEAPDANGGAPDAMIAAADAAVTDRPFTILDVNLLHGFPTGQMLQARTQIVIDTIRALQPDVVTVQEASVTPSYPNIAGQIAMAVGYEWVWHRASGFAGLFEEGPGVLSRWPIADWGYAQLETGIADLTGRVCVRAKIRSPYGDLFVTSIHATTSDDQNTKADEAVIAYQYAAAARGALPGIFAGDMNADPDTLVMRFLRGEVAHGGTMGDLLDAWAIARPQEPGFTDPSDNPRHRIDYVMILPGTGGAGRVDSCELVFDQPVSGIYASDHIGVLCHLAL